MPKKINESSEVTSHTPFTEQQCFELAKHRAPFQIISENKLDKVERD
jgi:hypothetical protein